MPEDNDLSMHQMMFLKYLERRVTCTPSDIAKQYGITYENYIEEIAAGHKNVLTSDEVQYFGLTSGTTGKQKRIPITAKTRKIANMSMMFLEHGALSQALPAARTGGRGLLLMNMLQSGSSCAKG